MKHRAHLVISFVLLLALVGTGLNITGAQDQKIVTVSIMLQDDIPTLDPSLVEDVSGVQALDGMIPGLTTLNEQSVTVETGIASSWDISEDGLTYTFHLIPEISWVHYDAASGQVVQVTDDAGNPRYVTAHDLVYGWQRSLNPLTISYYGAGVLAPWVVGGAALASLTPDENGNLDEAALQAARDGLGIEALDDYTFVVHTTGDFAFLPNIFGMWMARPEPQWAIEAFGESWTEAGNFESYGPFALKEWSHGESISFIKNPFWQGTDTIPVAKIDGWTNQFLEASAALANFEAGQLDYINPVSNPDLDRVRTEYPDEFGVGPGTCTYYYGFNVEKAPVDNVHMRRALSLALDRQAITVAITRAGEVPAAFFTRPDMVAAPQQADYPEVAPLTADLETRTTLAQEELAAYFEETGTTMADLPPITLVFNDSELHASIGEAAQEMWANVLGIDVSLANVEWGTYLDLRATDAPQIYRAAWCYDYPDANNWDYDVFRSDSAQADDGGNEPNWTNPVFDQLVREAASEKDPEARRDLYGQAEVILTWEDAVIAPIYYYSTTYMLSTRVEAVVSRTGIERFEKWDLIN
jgi:oligopeptide transport system substrate-binding protein